MTQDAERTPAKTAANDCRRQARAALALFALAAAVALGLAALKWHQAGPKTALIAGAVLLVAAAPFLYAARIARDAHRDFADAHQTHLRGRQIARDALAGKIPPEEAIRALLGPPPNDDPPRRT